MKFRHCPPKFHEIDKLFATSLPLLPMDGVAATRFRWDLGLGHGQIELFGGILLFPRQIASKAQDVRSAEGLWGKLSEGMALQSISPSAQSVVKKLLHLHADRRTRLGA